MTKDEIIKEIDKLGEDEKKKILEYLKKKKEKKPDNYKEAISAAFNTNKTPKRFLLLSICSKGDYECAGECSSYDLAWSYEEIRNNSSILEAFIDWGVDSGLFDPDISNEEVLDMFLIDDLTDDAIRQILKSRGVWKCQFKDKDVLYYDNGEMHFLVWDNETKEVEEYIC